MKTTIKIAVIAMMGMSLGVNGQDTHFKGNSLYKGISWQSIKPRFFSYGGNGSNAKWFLNNIPEDGGRFLVIAGPSGQNGSSNIAFSIEGNKNALFNGNVGIGTTEAKEKLDIRGNIYINSGVNDNRIFWEGHNMTMGTRSGSYSHNVFSLKPGGATQGKLFSVFDMYDANSKSDHQRKIRIHSSGTSYFNGGNVGIGTTDTKGFELGVNGKIAATEVKVATYSNWADFVFKKDYHLPTLKEVENHIKEKGHLKDIPSAKEVEKNGFFLGEMDSKLLQKIEELTLYTVAQEKEIKKEKAENKKQQKEIEELKALVQKLLKDKN